MGYEIKLIVGNLAVPCPSIDGDSIFLLEIASLKLSKCSYKGILHNLLDKVHKSKKYKKIYWSDLFSVQQKKVVGSIFGEDSFELDKEKHSDLKELLGPERDEVEANVYKIAGLFESWETTINEDSYGDVLRAIPIQEVYDAIKKDNELELAENEQTYKRYDIALALLESLMIDFPYSEPEENGHDRNLYCVLYGY